MELLQGALHGYGILLRIQQLSEDRLETQQGSLYATRRGTAGSFRAGSRANGRGGNKRKAKCYRLTAAGKSKLQTEAEKWNRMADVIAGILESTPEGI